MILTWLWSLGKGLERMLTCNKYLDFFSPPIPFIFISTRDHKFLTFPKSFKQLSLFLLGFLFLGFIRLLGFISFVYCVQSATPLLSASHLPKCSWQFLSDVSSAALFVIGVYTPLLIPSLSFSVSCTESLYQCLFLIFHE